MADFFNMLLSGLPDFPDYLAFEELLKHFELLLNDYLHILNEY